MTWWNWKIPFWANPYKCWNVVAICQDLCAPPQQISYARLEETTGKLRPDSRKWRRLGGGSGLYVISHSLSAGGNAGCVFRAKCGEGAAQTLRITGIFAAICLNAFDLFQAKRRNNMRACLISGLTVAPSTPSWQSPLSFVLFQVSQQSKRTSATVTTQSKGGGFVRIRDLHPDGKSNRQWDFKCSPEWRGCVAVWVEVTDVAKDVTRREEAAETRRDGPTAHNSVLVRFHLLSASRE